MIFLEFQHVVSIHKIIVQKWGGACGIRSKELIESAICNPKNLFFYEEANIYVVAASYATSLIKNHGFIDGNKRTGFACMNAFLEINDIIISFPEDETVDMMVNVAASKISLMDLSEYLKKLHLLQI